MFSSNPNGTFFMGRAICATFRMLFGDFVIHRFGPPESIERHGQATPRGRRNVRPDPLVAVGSTALLCQSQASVVLGAMS